MTIYILTIQVKNQKICLWKACLNAFTEVSFDFFIISNKREKQKKKTAYINRI